MEPKKRKPRNSTLTGPASIEEARKMGQIRAVHAAPIWGMSPDQLRRRCIRGEIPEAVKIGHEWKVTPQGMDAYCFPKK